MSLAARDPRDHPISPPPRGGAVRGAAGDLALGMLPLSAAAGASWRLFHLPASYLLWSIGLYGMMAALLMAGVGGVADAGGVARAGEDRPHPSGRGGRGLGQANRVTLARATLVLPVAALVLSAPMAGGSGFYWWVIALSTVAMSLDGVDGRIARRTATTSAFGARFDMELDAFLLLVLSVLVWRSDKVGVWVLSIGGLRYLFVAAGWIWTPLRGNLPESRRRKTVCVVQGVALLVCLGPIIPPWMAVAAAAVSLGLLVYSFGVDVWWLAARAPTA